MEFKREIKTGILVPKSESMTWEPYDEMCQIEINQMVETED